MYLRKFSVSGIRSVNSLDMEFEKGREAGWHVLLGANGSGKSSVVRSLALLQMGEKEAYAARQDFSRWIQTGSDTATISGTFSMEEGYDDLTGKGQPPKKSILGKVEIARSAASSVKQAELKFTGERIQRALWGAGKGWFSASFGPFRRFTGGDRIYDRLFVSNPRLAPHLTALGEDVALTEAVSWFSSLVRQVNIEFATGKSDDVSLFKQPALQVISTVMSFINNNSFLPYGATIVGLTSEDMLVRDGNGVQVTLDQLSDGYRSALSMTLELIRQMFELYGHERMLSSFDELTGTIQAPGVVAIDEVDVHLHPNWQRDIGRWLTKFFPRIQFIVTTHSPIVCRAVADTSGTVNGSVWQLPSPGSSRQFRQIVGAELEQLLFGDILEAYGTHLFGDEITRSPAGQNRVARLAALNTLALSRRLTVAEQSERRMLRAAFTKDAASGEE